MGIAFKKEVFAYYKQLMCSGFTSNDRWELLSKRGLCILQTTPLLHQRLLPRLGIAFKKRSLHITNNAFRNSSSHHWLGIAFKKRSLHITNNVEVVFQQPILVGNCFQKEVFAYYKQLLPYSRVDFAVGNCFQKEVFAYYKQLMVFGVVLVFCWELLSKRGLCIFYVLLVYAQSALGIAFKKRSLHITNNRISYIVLSFTLLPSNLHFCL